MSGTRKKVIVRRLDDDLHRGYLPAIGLAPGNELDLLLPDGRALFFSLAEVKHVAFVKDFNLDDSSDPERIGMRSFASKPRTGGLWVRFQFLHGDTLEGLVHGGLAFLDALLVEHGVFMDLPDKRSNTQRLFVPRSALANFEVLGVSGGAPTIRRTFIAQPQRQTGLFDEPDHG